MRTVKWLKTCGLSRYGLILTLYYTFLLRLEIGTISPPPFGLTEPFPPRPSSFFSLSSVVRPAQIFSISEKKKLTTELNHFSLEISLLIWKMNVVQHREKQEHFLQYIVHFVNPNMWMLTFTVGLGYQDLLLQDFLWIFFLFFFFNPTYQPNIRKCLWR